MASPRYTQVDIEATPYYHCISRCVRRAFLCGKDTASGRNFDHRKAWVVERIASLANVFAIRICAFAVLSNHFHLVLRIEFETGRAWDDDEVVRRYTQLFQGAEDPRKHLIPGRAAERIRCWRARLADLSWGDGTGFGTATIAATLGVTPRGLTRVLADGSRMAQQSRISAADGDT